MKKEMNIPVVELDQLASAIDQLGADHNMQRNRPYNGQAWTSGGVRGSTQIVGLSMRDMQDCYLRAYILSHSSFKSDSIELIEPNATLVTEAMKGENAALCANDLYTLVGDIDPVAVSQNFLCEIEKMMGIFPNILPKTSESILKDLFGDTKPNI